MQSWPIKYRPKKLFEVTEQEVPKTILQYQLNEGNISNVYLFLGTPGSGKTSTARIMFKELNGQGNFVEIDAATNSSVENVKQIVDETKFPPLTGKYKCFLIDESHMFSNTAWNALLALIEQPPSYVKIIFCTTEIRKIPETIISRCHVLNFKPISIQGIIDRLKFICKEEEVEYEEECLNLIARNSKGQLRTAITLLEKCYNFNKNLTLKTVKLVINDLIDNYYQFYANYLANKQAKCLEILQFIINQGQLTNFVEGFKEYLTDLLKIKLTDCLDFTKLPGEYLTKVRKLNSDYIKITRELLYNVLEIQTVNIKEDIIRIQMEVIIFRRDSFDRK